MDGLPTSHLLSVLRWPLAGGVGLASRHRGRRRRRAGRSKPGVP